ncbi:hsp90 co-chaperone Cdc37-like 1 isoform X3 [Opisthocomus hoazin]|uniref:hsp90 co-chaperone Cdc37-like 1 isoform X3 n=1 Tax=Opisthocomus hoazin TaxID=30419 RepID=UPI003F539838
MALWSSSFQGPGSVEDDERELTLTSIQRLSETQSYGQEIELICQKQKEFVKSSVEIKWNLAEAQQKLGSLALHNSESTDQEYAKAQTEASELRKREEEWRRKEEALIQRERHNLWNTDSFSKEVFNKSFISQYKRKEEDEDISKSFIQKHEQKIRYFGMLGRWDDSQRFLSDHPYLVCEETAKYLILWCFHLEAEQKRALMDQIAHQAVVMQFIIEMARNCNVDPRGCFRLFFQKAKAGEEGYLEAFKTELEAFKSRVRICSQSQGFQAMSAQNPSVYTGIVEGLESLSQNANDLQGCTNRSVCNLNSMLQKGEETKMMDTV